MAVPNEFPLTIPNPLHTSLHRCTHICLHLFTHTRPHKHTKCALTHNLLQQRASLQTFYSSHVSSPGGTGNHPSTVFFPGASPIVVSSPVTTTSLSSQEISRTTSGGILRTVTSGGEISRTGAQIHESSRAIVGEISRSTVTGDPSRSTNTGESCRSTSGGDLSSIINGSSYPAPEIAECSEVTVGLDHRQATARYSSHTPD